MKKTMFFTLLLLMIAQGVFSQTNIIFLDTFYDPAAPSDTAYKQTNTLENGKWHRRTYLYRATPVLVSEGFFSDEAGTNPAGGNFSYYDSTGNLIEKIKFNDAGKGEVSEYFYPSGKLRARVIYDGNGNRTQSAYNEDGSPRHSDMVERDADFPGGIERWKEYLIHNLNARVAADAGMPAGEYNVMSKFIVSKTGVVSNVRIESTTPPCNACEREVIRVLESSPTWIPAIQFERPVNAYRRQPFTFVVQEEKKRKRLF